MKNLLVCCCLALLSATAFAQVEEQVNDTLPADQQDHGEVHKQKEDRVEIMTADIPPTMKTELEKNENYAGWETGNIFFEKNTGQYLLQIQKSNTTQIFRFDKDGKPLQDEKVIDPQEDRN